MTTSKSSARDRGPRGGARPCARGARSGAGAATRAAPRAAAPARSLRRASGRGRAAGRRGSWVAPAPGRGRWASTSPSEWGLRHRGQARSRWPSRPRPSGMRSPSRVALQCAVALGLDPARVVPIAAACELLHNATLVHDDLHPARTPSSLPIRPRRPASQSASAGRYPAGCGASSGQLAGLPGPRSRTTVLWRSRTPPPTPAWAGSFSASEPMRRITEPSRVNRDWMRSPCGPPSPRGLDGAVVVASSSLPRGCP